MDFINSDATGYGTVEVGKMMRAKYPPSHFRGESNPAHVQVEAWRMMVDGLDKNEKNGNHVSFVDGQPRTVSQAKECIRLFPDAVYLHLFSDDESRKLRLFARDGSDPEKMALSNARFETDSVNNYKVWLLLAEAKAAVVVRRIPDCSEAERRTVFQEIINELDFTYFSDSDN